jgi:iron complex transport system substrate-binding protein
MPGKPMNPNHPPRIAAVSARARQLLGRLALGFGAAALAACEAGEQAGSAAHAVAAVEPVTVPVCGYAVRYDRVPERVVTHDANITELFLALGLGDRLVGYSGIPSAKAVAPEFRAQLTRVPNLSDRDMNLETLVGAHADFVFAGWSYGFREGNVTPASLQAYGIQSYVLTESCIRKQPRERVSVEDTFADMRNLGRIFRIDAHAEALVARQQAELAEIAQALAGVRQRPGVFVYDSGVEAPTTSGRFGMPHAMIEAAGGRNIFDDIASNWPKGNWEDVVERDPDWIVIVDYGQPGAQGKIDFLLGKPELANVAAIRNRRFVVLEYAEATPGPRNVARTRTLAHAFHPERLP